MSKFLDTKFRSWWEHQQDLSWRRIKKVFKQFFVYFPLGYLELFTYVLFSILSAPVIISRSLYYWLRKALKREVGGYGWGKLSKKHRKQLYKESVENIEFSMNLAEKLIVFIFGVGATLLGLFLSNYLKN